MGFFKKKVKQKLIFPFIDGTTMAIEEVPDEAFATKLMGDGIAIDPANGTVYAPCDAKVTMVADTGHAVGLETADGLELLIHVGIDTVGLKGEGFKLLTAENKKVKKGDPLIEFDIDFVKSKELSPIVILLLISDTYQEITTKSLNKKVDKTSEFIVEYK